MIAAYLRVSSRSQSLSTQRDAIERMAKARGDDVATWFSETRTGKKLERPVLDHVRDLAQRGAIGTLYVFRLDRLTRSGIRDTLEALEGFRSAGCKVLSVADGFDLEGPASQVVIAVVAWAAQMERLALGERISAARARVEKAGGRWGRPRRVAPHEVHLVEVAHSKGKTIREISVGLKIPRSTVASVLSKKGAYATPRARARKQALKKT